MQIDCSALQAQLAEIDENLIRNNGAKNRSNNYGKNLENDIMSFSSDTSAKTGKSIRTTERKTTYS